MIEPKNGIRIHAHAAITLAVGAVLAACSAHSSTAPTANVSPTANTSPTNVSPTADVRDPPTGESELPEIVVTARAPERAEESNERIREANAGGQSVPDYIVRDRAAKARKARVPSNSPDETG